MSKLSSLIRWNGITMTAEWVNTNKNAPDWKDANHYRVTLKMGRRRLTTYFSQGYGIKDNPTVVDVLYCLAEDAASIENTRSFEEWANNLGYDADSRKAEKIFKVVERQAEALKKFLGDGLYNKLLWRTERDYQ